MLNIYLGEMKEAIYHPPTYFDNRYEDEWITDSLSVKMPGQQVLNGFDGYDVAISQEEAASYIAICSEAALNSLVFTNASFVCQ